MRPVTLEPLRKVLVVLTWLYFAFLAYELFNPRPISPPRASMSLIHFYAFGLLGGMVGLARRRWSPLVWGILLAGWGYASELIQPYTGRYFEYADIAQDAVGAWVGLAGACLIRRIFVKRYGGRNGER